MARAVAHDVGGVEHQPRSTHTNTDRGQLVGPRTHDRRSGNHVVEQQPTWPIEIGQHGVEHAGPLTQTALDAAPLLGVDDVRHRIETPRHAGLDDRHGTRGRHPRPPAAVRQPSAAARSHLHRASTRCAAWIPNGDERCRRRRRARRSDLLSARTSRVSRGRWTRIHGQAGQALWAKYAVAMRSLMVPMAICSRSALRCSSSASSSAEGSDDDSSASAALQAAATDSLSGKSPGRGLHTRQAIGNRSRKRRLTEDEPDHLWRTVAHRRSAVVHLQRRQRPQDARPLQIVVQLGALRPLAEEQPSTDVEHSRHHVGALDVATEAQHGVRLVAAHRRRQDAEQPLVRGDHRLQEPRSVPPLHAIGAPRPAAR